MRVLIPSYGRAATATTPDLLEGIDWAFLVHNWKERQAYADRYGTDRVLTTDVEPGWKGGLKQKFWALENVVRPGEWVAFFDDDVHRVRRLADPWFHGGRNPFGDMTRADRRYYLPLKDEWFVDVAGVDVAELLDMVALRGDEMGFGCGGFGASYDGWALTYDTLWEGFGAAVGGVCVLKENGSLTGTLNQHDDLMISMEYLEHDGGLALLTWAQAHAGVSAAIGGYGRHNARRQVEKQGDADRMMARWPGALKLVDYMGRAEDGKAFKDDWCLRLRGEHSFRASVKRREAFA